MPATGFMSRCLVRPRRWVRRALELVGRTRQFEARIGLLELAIKDLSSKVEASTLEILAVTAMALNQQHEQRRILERLDTRAEMGKLDKSSSDQS